MNREEAIKFGKRVLSLSLFDETHEFCKLAVKALEQTALLDQVRWERDVAIKQLADLGYGLGEKIRECEDAISRQAAIDLCERFDGSVPYSVLSSHDMLPSVSTETTNRCEDAVSRELVKKDIARWIGYIDEDMIARMHITIDKLPSVSTEKTGRWEWNQYDYNPNLGNWHCSECGSIVIECVHKKDPSGVPLYKYCPQCGCRLMEVEE